MWKTLLLLCIASMLIQTNGISTDSVEVGDGNTVGTGQESQYTTCSLLEQDLTAKNIRNSECLQKLAAQTCELSCMGDYFFPSGETVYSIQCQNGIWEHIPTCAKKKCGPPNINKKNIVSASYCTNVEVGGECSLECIENYAISKTISITQTINCKAGGTWENISKCKDIKCASPPKKHSTYTIQSPCSKNITARCLSTCKENYKLSPSTTTRKQIHTCNLNPDKISASWVPPFQECEAIECPEYNLQESNAQKFKATSCPVSTIDQTCELTCEENYILEFPRWPRKNKHLMTCKLDSTHSNIGQWSALPTCQAIQCPEYNLQESNAQKFKATSCPVSTIGQTCELTCEENYILQYRTYRTHRTNKHVMTCKLDSTHSNIGQWSALPTCQEILCASPATHPTYTIQTTCSKKINTECSVTCKENYKLSTATTTKTQTSRCNLNSDKISASWYPIFQECEAIKCLDDLQETNARKFKAASCTPTTIGQTCQLTCKENHFLQRYRPYRPYRTNKHVMTCKLDSTHSNIGQWSALPTCQEITCDNNPAIPNNVKVPTNCKGTAVGGTCTLECEEGFILPGTHSQTIQTVTCTQKKYYYTSWWKPGATSCKANTVEIGSCNYWHSYNRTTDIARAEVQCVAALGTGAIVSILKNNTILGEIRSVTSEMYYRVGAEKKGNQWKWKDGDSVKDIVPIASHNCLVVNTLTTEIEYRACSSGIPFICEKSTGFGNPCHPNPCTKGSCSKYGCSFKCDCANNAYGYLCDKSQIQVNFVHSSYQVLRGRSVSVQFKIIAHVTGTISYSIKVNNRVVKTSAATIISGKMQSYDIADVQKDLKIEVEAKLTRNNQQLLATAAEELDINVNEEATVKVSDEIRFTAGSASSISCEVTGIPTPFVTWLKDGTIIRTGKMTGQFSFNNLQAEFNDNGIYKCIAKHTVGLNATAFQAEAEVQVIVEGVPEYSETATTIENNAATLTCTFDGNPLPTIRWMLKNGSDIPISSQFKLGETVNKSSFRTSKNLTVYGASCLGIYNMEFTCEGNNTFGSRKSKPYQVIPVTISKERKRCNGAISTCVENNSRLLTLRNDEERGFMESLLDKSMARNLWINKKSSKYLTTKANGYRKCKTLKWPNYYYHNKRFACEEIPANPAIKVTRYGCKGAELDISFTAKPGASSLQHTAYVGTQKFSLKPGEASFSVSNLSANTEYDVTIIPHFTGCTLVRDYYNSTKIKTLSGKIQVPKSFMLEQKSGNCQVTWNSTNNHGIGSYQLKLIEQVRSTKKYLPNPTNISLKITTSHKFQMKPNTIYHIHLGVTASYPCQDKINSSWTKQQMGSCVSSPSSPEEIVLPSIKPLPQDNQMKVILTAADERNGNVSCYMIVVSKINGDQIGNVTTNISQLKQAGDQIQDGDSYIAFAIQRFDGSKSLQLGAGGRTCCNMQKLNSTCTTDLPTVKNSTRMKRAPLKHYVVRGDDRKLDQEGKYSVFLIVSTPADGRNEPMLKASPISKSHSFENEGGGNTAAAIAIPIVVVLILSFLIAGFLNVRKRKRLKSHPVERHPMRTRHSTNDSNDTIDVVYPHAGNRNNESPDAIVTRYLSSYTLNLEYLARIITDKRADDDMQFKEEFKTEISDAVEACSLTNDIAKLPANRKKNRYRNIIPYDSSRVVLSKQQGDEFSDYVNASHLDGYNFPGKFIASQGPKPNTINSFWRMIWEHQVFVIAMLTKLKEKEKVKCAQYWPEQENTVTAYGDLKITHTETAHFGDYVRRKFDVEFGDQQRTVMQFQFIAWPDHGIPNMTSSLLRFHKSVIQAQPHSAGPIAVHCSAGAGRTGTFIALDILSEQIMREEQINIAAHVGQMRTKRSQMVQSLDQYIFIHKLVLEIYQFGDTDVDVSRFGTVFNELLKMNSEIRTTELQREFSMLDYFLPLDTAQESALKLINKAYNLNASVLPYNHNLVFVQMQATDKSAPYYNASYINSYHFTNKFIAAQTPTTVSVSIFWRTIVDNNVSMIVMLCQNKEGFCYWPKIGKEGKYGQVTVRTLKETVENDYSERTIAVTYKEKKISLTQIQYDKWPEHEPPESQTVILEIIAKVEKLYQTMSNTQTKTTLVHCSDGAGRTGAFCAISNLIDRLKNENRIDVFRAVKDLRDLRQNMVNTVNLYEFCYRAVSEFLESFDLYGNFR